eukprot:TRINITY_DN3666_c0_g1_i5.p1 TRINITY_DN3666_c0_g1~~TRINITY_DN3666_c0_g1_i5.p1  ORF type:complete len:416 (-),score=60.19 TRINITY_DN3666_c0_g1_i5:29-1240(-)
MCIRDRYMGDNNRFIQTVDFALRLRYQRVKSGYHLFQPQDLQRVSYPAQQMETRIAAAITRQILATSSIKTDEISLNSAFTTNNNNFNSTPPTGIQKRAVSTESAEISLPDIGIVLSLCQVSPQVIVCGGFNGSAYVVDKSSKSVVKKIVVNAKSSVSAVTGVQDLSLLATATYDGDIEIYDWRQGESAMPLKSFKKVDSGQVYALAQLKTASTVVFGGASGRVSLLDWRSGRFERKLRLHNGHHVYKVASLSQSGIGVSASADKTVGVWNWRTSKLVKRFRHSTRETDYVSELERSGKLAISAAGEGLLIWNMLSGATEKTISMRNVQKIASIPEMGWLVCGGYNKKIAIYDWINDVMVKICADHSGPIFGIVYDEQAKEIMSGSADRSVRILKIPQQKQSI